MNSEPNKSNFWIKIIEADLCQLIQLNAYSFQLELEQSLYLKVQLAYMRSEVNELETQISIIQNYLINREMLSNNKINYDLLELINKIAITRIEIRKRSVTDRTISRLQSIEYPDLIWKGEVYFLLARAYGIIGDHINQKESYLKASFYYEQAQALRKSLKALQNAFAIEGFLNPNKRLTLEYNLILQKALELGDVEVAGLTSLNLSREMQLLGSKSMAMQYANDSIRYLQKDKGSLHFGLAVCHRAQLLFECGRTEECQRDIEEASMLEFPEVKSALTLLTNHLQNKKSYQSPEHLTLPWQNREFNGNYRTCNFAPLEEQLILILSQGPLNTHEIISKIFADEIKCIDYQTIINRFKNLLTRIKKKSPNLIIRENGKYCLSGVSHETTLLTKSI